MEIKDLPIELQELALKRAKEHCIKCKIGCYSYFDKFQELSSAFIWKHTPEGQEYWGNVNTGYTTTIPK